MAPKGIFRITINRHNLGVIKDAAPEFLDAFQDELLASARQKSPYQTGTNRRSIDGDAAKSADAPAFTFDSEDTRRVFTQDGYGGLLETGTGIFGPTGKRIEPTNAKALFWPGAAHPVRSVKGRPATPYFRPALDATVARARLIAGQVKRLLERRAIR